MTEQQRRLQIKQKYLERIGYVLGKGLLDQRDLYITIRGFFSEFLKLEYEFTYEELSLELNKIFIKPSDKLNIDNFLYDLSESEYLTDRNLEQDEIKVFLGRLDAIIKSLIPDASDEIIKKSFFDKLLNKKSAVEELVPDKKLMPLEDIKEEAVPIEMPSMDPVPAEMLKKPEPGIADFMQSQRENYLLKAGMFLQDNKDATQTSNAALEETKLVDEKIEKKSQQTKSVSQNDKNSEDNVQSEIMFAKDDNQQFPQTNIKNIPGNASIDPTNSKKRSHY